ncbi:MAG: SIR2 family protein [Saprospiraceae bacterium]
MKWDSILQSIKDKKCVLFTGPQLVEFEYNTSDGVSLAPARTLVKSRLEEHPEINMYYYEMDELFLFEEEDHHNEARSTLKRYLNNLRLNGDLFRQIMKIDFPFIINFSPYLNPSVNFPKIDIPYPFDYQYYHKSPNKNPVRTGLNNDLWIYDLFGNLFEDESSIVLTYNDLFDYIRSVLGAKDFPLEFKRKLAEANYFLFLGFSFEKWYVQLLIRLLREICNGNERDRSSIWRAVKNAQKDQVDPSNFTATTLLYKKELNLKFITEIESAKDFIAKLYNECEMEHLLRHETNHENYPTSFYNELSVLLGESKIEEVVEKIFGFFDGKDDGISDEIILHKSRLVRLNTRYKQGVLEEKDYSLEIAKITIGLQSIIKKVKDYA